MLIEKKIDEMEKKDDEKEPRHAALAQKESANNVEKQSDFNSKYTSEHKSEAQSKHLNTSTLSLKNETESQSKHLKNNILLLESQSTSKELPPLAAEKRFEGKEVRTENEEPRRFSLKTEENRETHNPDAEARRPVQRQHSSLQKQTKAKSEKSKSKLCTIM